MINQLYDLDAEEQAIEDALEAGELVQAQDIEAVIADLKAAARTTLKKSRTINIRLSERDIHHLKMKAANEGLPYQTFISSSLHKLAAI
jgi:predicted DNA binding CopG/RHH family protein